MTKVKLSLLAAAATPPVAGSAFAADITMTHICTRKLRLVLRVLLVCAAGSAAVLGTGQSLAQNAYVPNYTGRDVSGINTGTNMVIATIPLSGTPVGGVGVSPDGSRACVSQVDGIAAIDTSTNTVIARIPINGLYMAVSPNGRAYAAFTDVYGFITGAVAVIDTTTNTVITTIPVGCWPSASRRARMAPAFTLQILSRTHLSSILRRTRLSRRSRSADGRHVYVTDNGDDAVSVIDTATNAVIATVPVGFDSRPEAVAVTPDSTRVYVANLNTTCVSVIDAATNTVIATVPVGVDPDGVSVTPDGKRVYAVNDFGSCTPNYMPPGFVSVIDTATNAVVATVPVGGQSIAQGVFIAPGKPAPKFAGTPGKANCYGKSVSALARQYGGLNNAAAALGYPSVSALQNAISAYCEA